MSPQFPAPEAVIPDFVQWRHARILRKAQAENPGKSVSIPEDSAKLDAEACAAKVMESLAALRHAYERRFSTLPIRIFLTTGCEGIFAIPFEQKPGCMLRVTADGLPYRPAELAKSPRFRGCSYEEDGVFEIRLVSGEQAASIPAAA